MTCRLAGAKVGVRVHPEKRTLLWIVGLGGAAVLTGYACGFGAEPAAVAALWGGVPQHILPFYYGNMVLATAGYFAFSYFILFRLDPEQARIAHRLRFGLFNALYVSILVPSALWIPLTLAMVNQPGMGLWWTIRLTLAVVGLASATLTAALVSVDPRKPAFAYWLAVAGSIAFTLQTAVLDAAIWPAFFPR